MKERYDKEKGYHVTEIYKYVDGKKVKEKTIPADNIMARLSNHNRTLKYGGGKGNWTTYDDGTEV